MSCARCHADIAPELLRSADDLCTYCATLTRIEFDRGLARLQGYLAHWAAFERWLAEREHRRVASA